MSQYTAVSKDPDSRYDPPDEPEIEDNDELLSTCCSANSDTEIVDGLGICSLCKEHAEFTPNGDLP